MNKLIIISMFMLLFTANTANAWTKEGRTLVQTMKAYNDPQGTLNFSAGDYVGYVGGVVDSIMGVHCCAPDGVEFEALLDIVSNYLNNHPELWDLSAYVLVVKALNEAFPCNQ